MALMVIFVPPGKECGTISTSVGGFPDDSAGKETQQLSMCLYWKTGAQGSRGHRIFWKTSSPRELSQ